jgi:hypothetical protein
MTSPYVPETYGLTILKLNPTGLARLLDCRIVWAWVHIPETSKAGNDAWKRKKAPYGEGKQETEQSV